ncbi:MAG: S-formylglutathione hydrolase, partial [Steroidobacteraceae bacterium]
DFGLAAGFYVDATAAPWSAHYRMYSYVTRELPAFIATHFASADTTRQSIMGHSMGGHGALVCALRNPLQYRSVSAFAPIVAPAQVPWGHKAFGNYLGPDTLDWREYDATQLVRRTPRPDEILIDQGLADKFLVEQLRPDLFAAACAESGQKVQLRRHAGYDHGYYFIQTFMPDHVAWHARALQAD